MRLLEMEDESVAPWILSALTFVGKYKPLGKFWGEDKKIVNFFFFLRFFFIVMFSL